MAYTLPTLPYSYNALEPHIDAKTMEIHHTKHHQAYIDNVNKALEGTPWADMPVDGLLRNLAEVPADKKAAVRNHGGGHSNHSFFWTILGPQKGGKPSGDLLTTLEKTFESFEKFQEKFEAAAKGQFGSGWAWLTIENGKLKIENSANQDSPLSSGRTPILGVDVWEHAYYLKYQNKRPEYLKAFWQVVNWDEVQRRFVEAT
ncbi:superoxide dismutase [Candidatus Peregrinibacteria bacterium]|nr:superoxide dismutase [Candidatus Peregrinibacteria bacterium]